MKPVDSIADVLRRGRARWPDVQLSEHALLDHVEAVSAPLERVVARADDFYLAAACATGNAPALRVFAELINDTRAAVSRYGDEDFVNEVLQRVRVHLLVADENGATRVGRFDGRASLRSWLGICSIRMALYLLRTQRNRRESSADLHSALFELGTEDATLEGLKQQYAAAFREALESASEELSSRQRAVMRLRFAHGLSLDQISTTYAVHRATAWRWLRGAQETLLERLANRLRVAVADDDIGLDSLLGLIRSRIEISMSGLFEDDAL